jgi:hypothetical protein
LVIGLGWFVELGPRVSELVGVWLFDWVGLLVEGNEHEKNHENMRAHACACTHAPLNQQPGRETTSTSEYQNKWPEQPKTTHK